MEALDGEEVEPVYGTLLPVRNVLAILCLFASHQAWADSSLDIVRDGRPVAAVVLAEEASQQLKAAAEVLSACVEESTGAKLSVVTDPPDQGTIIVIGKTYGITGDYPDQTGLDDDGFDIAFPDDRTILIVGPTDWGTEFGVYEFLERTVGVRWLMPGEDGTDIPEHRTITVSPEPVRQEPAFFSRLFSGLRGEVQTEWARRNRMHGRVSFHHHLLRLFPPETYTKTHPEFFPMHGGKRVLPPTNDTHHWQPCFTAEGLVEEAIHNVNRYFDENPDAVSYSLGTNDSSGYCECESCLARISGEKNFLGRVDYSGLYYDWANRVIEGVLEKHPGKWFGCLAYSEVAAPPQNVKVHPRMIPYMTYDRMKWVDPEIRRVGEELTQAWHERSPVLGWYDYIYGTPYCLPRVWFHHMADYYRFGQAHGVRALYAEAYPNWGEGPKLYISLKLQWDPQRDVDELLDEWMVRCVGKGAAKSLSRYYRHWERFWTDRIRDSSWFSRGGQYLSFYNPSYLNDIELAEIQQSRHWLERTLEKAGTEKQKARAGLLLDAFEYYEATAYAYKAQMGAPQGTIRTEDQALALLDRVTESAEYAERRRHLALEVFPEHPLLVHPIDITRNSLLTGDSWGASSLWKVYEVVASSGGPLRERVRQMAEHHESPTVNAQAQMMLSLIENKLEPLTANASFEQGEGTSAESWSWWVKWGAGSMGRTDELSHTGDHAVVCLGMKRGGPVQAINVEPGRYGLVCFVYVPRGQESKGTAELSMTLRDAKDQNLTSFSTQTVPPPGRWTPLAVAGDVPDRVGAQEVDNLLPILIVNGFEADEKIYFDDLALYRLQE